MATHKQQCSLPPSLRHGSAGVGAGPDSAQARRDRMRPAMRTFSLLAASCSKFSNAAAVLWVTLYSAAG